MQLDNLTIDKAGNYKCIVSDYEFEVASEIAVVRVSSLDLSLEVVNIVCKGEKTASITVNAANSIGTLNYTLKGMFDKRYNQLSNVFGDLTRGSYTIIVKDEIGCLSTATTTINEPPALSVKLNATATKCNSGTDGSVETVVAGGVAPYTYEWSNSETTPILTNVVANTYSVIVTDANGCTADNKTIINQPVAIEVNVYVSNERNAGKNSGSIRIVASNGHIPYEYTLGGAVDDITQPDNLFDGLNHGIYTVLTKDANGCTTTTEAEITARYYEPEVIFNLTTNGLTVETTNYSKAADSYSWTFDDGTTLTDEAPSHTYSDYGEYNVSLTATNTYGSKTVSKLITLSKSTQTSISYVENAIAVKVYPNPSNGKFTLSYSSDKTIGDLTVRIVTLTGQLISIEKFNVADKDMSKEFDISGIAHGMYFIETVSNRGTSTQQIVIK